MRISIMIILALTLPALSHAQDPGDPLPRLQFSWSASVQQDTLHVMESGWTHCYLWVHPSPLRNGFVGFWGTLYQTHAVEVHRWRYLGEGGGEDSPVDPQADELAFGYLDAPCEDDTGSRVVAEFDVWIAMEKMPAPGSRPSAVGLLEANASFWKPMVFYRKERADPCGYLSEGYPAEPNSLVALPAPVSVVETTFGTLKAIYR